MSGTDFGNYGDEGGGGGKQLLSPGAQEAAVANSPSDFPTHERR